MTSPAGSNDPIGKTRVRCGGLFSSMRAPPALIRTKRLLETKTGKPMSEQVDLYNKVYGDFGSHAETAVRNAAFGQDIGQSSWITAQDWLRFADQANVREAS